MDKAAAPDEVALVVVGAGPAGMAAATTAAAAGLSVAVLDEQPGPGGQIYRAVAAPGGGWPRRDAVLGPDYAHGAGLVQALRDSPARHIPGATVWQIDTDGSVTYSVGGVARRIRGHRLILATGALERPVPVPGWTLPGVMTAGAGQILLKASGIVAARAVLAGSGPLLYLLATQMIRAGTPPLALVETGRRRDLVRALPHLPAALRGWRTLLKGVSLLAELRRAGLTRHSGATDLAVEGTDRAEALTFHSGGRRHRIPCATVLLHQGVVPDTQATRSLRLDHLWDDGQRAFRPRTDRWGESSATGIFVAGDGAGINGALAAAEAGRLAALQVAFQLDAISRADRDRAATPAFARLKAERTVRPFLEAAYAPPAAILRPADTTVICRCEEVTAGDVRAWSRQGATGPNQTKAFGRTGMGPCQGRYCGLTVTEILAEAQGRPPASVGAYRIRPPLKPITLAELAALDDARPTETPPS